MFSIFRIVRFEKMNFADLHSTRKTVIPEFLLLIFRINIKIIKMTLFGESNEIFLENIL